MIFLNAGVQISLSSLNCVAIFNNGQLALWALIGSAGFIAYSMPAIRKYVSVLQQK